MNQTIKILLKNKIFLKIFQKNYYFQNFATIRKANNRLPHIT